MRRKILSNSDGVSLLEVLIGMIILAVGLMGLAPMVVVSIEGNVISRDNSIAANLLKQKVEYYEGLKTMPTVPYREVETGLETIYTRATSIQDATVDASIPNGVYKIDVVVSWTDNQNVQRSNQYSTYKVKSS
ncbi:MAG: prepilin-type N-terminal cleavage/methylation domain-containing protein [Candidatus Zixiibacteriota bacterium]